MTTNLRVRIAAAALASASAATAVAGTPSSALAAAPGQGLKAGDFDTVLLSWNQTTTPTGLRFSETVYLLFKDGTAYEGLALAPEDFDVEAAHRLQPGRWVRWRKSGATYAIQHAGQNAWRALKAWPAVQAGTDERPSGAYVHAWYRNNGLLGGAAGKTTVVFKPDGRFEELGMWSAGTGAMQGTSGFSSRTVSTAGPDGTRTANVTSATGGDPHDPAVAVAGASRRRNDGAAHAGTYRIQGWGIELHRDNGVVERELFLFSSGKRDGLNIGGVDFLAQK
jgi:hypothetical protein